MRIFKMLHIPTRKDEHQAQINKKEGSKIFCDVIYMKATSLLQLHIL
jgi:hypothetical protein